MSRNISEPIGYRWWQISNSIYFGAIVVDSGSLAQFTVQLVSNKQWKTVVFPDDILANVINSYLYMNANKLKGW